MDYFNFESPNFENFNEIDNNLREIHIPETISSRGKILRDRTPFFTTYHYIFNNSTQILKAKQHFLGYKIYSDNKLTGILKSNIWGNEYTFYLNNIENLYIEYECHFLRYRKPRSFIVAYTENSIFYNKNKFNKKNMNIKNLYKNGKFNNLIVLHNKKPIFCVETNSYVLNFNGRVTLPSVKNFQLIHPMDPSFISLTFGRVDRDEFVLDFQYPWTHIQAFAIALSSLDSKYGCE